MNSNCDISIIRLACPYIRCERELTDDSKLVSFDLPSWCFLKTINLIDCLLGMIKPGSRQ